MESLLKIDYAKNAAIQLLRVKFGGLIPEMVTAKECLELMLQLAEFETKRADEAQKMATEFCNRYLQPIFIKKG